MVLMRQGLLFRAVFMDGFIDLLCGVLMTIMLTVCGVVLALRIKLGRILTPREFIKTLRDSQTKDGISPFKAMCTALAGTLGVGNIAGVATAITGGGAGAVFWMWIGAIVSMSVKYGEVVLAVKYRHRIGGRLIGGTMYTVRDGLKKLLGRRCAAVLGGAFALLCIANSVITGNVVQTNSAAAAISSLPEEVMGAILAVCILIIGFVGAKRITTLTSALIPPLSLIYVLMSMSVILRNMPLIPEIFADIFAGAFTPRAAVSGAVGMSVREAVKLGFTRGIFSNEAGCGTAPSAHAAAEAKSPHHQGCFGIFEVIADTLILCSMTAFVILISGKKFGVFPSDGVPLTLDCFEASLGIYAKEIIAWSVVLFAFATVMAQLFYADVALGYFNASRTVRRTYVFVAAGAAFLGTVIDTGIMWKAADLIVGLMTVINVTVLLVMSGEIGDCSPYCNAKACEDLPSPSRRSVRIK